MKKIILISMVTALLFASVTGCSRSSDIQSENNLEDKAKVEQTTPNSSMVNDASSGKSDASLYIGEERAKEIALQRAGITSDEVLFDRVEFEKDDGIWLYEVEFRKGNTKYSADIKADDGKIISFETEIGD